MDPDKTLELIRDVLGRVDNEPQHDEYDEQLRVLDELAEAVIALDMWMSKGGFAPRAWKRY